MGARRCVSQTAIHSCASILAALLLIGSPAVGDVILSSNLPRDVEDAEATAQVPRTGGADEAMFSGPAALITSMRFGDVVFPGGPAAFDVRVTLFDDINFAATAAQPPSFNQVAHRLRGGARVGCPESQRAHCCGPSRKR